MAFYDIGKVGETFNSLWETGKSTVMDSGGNKVKEAPVKLVKTAIKGSGLVIRKLYEAKINVVNEFADVKPDWYFWDSDTIKHRIKNLQKELTAAQKQKPDDKPTRPVSAIAADLLINAALLSDNFEECDKLINDYCLTTPLARHGLPCLKARANGNHREAVEHAVAYYEANQHNIEHPYIGLYVAIALSDNGKYREAVPMLKLLVQSYPEDPYIHKLLREYHAKTGNALGLKVEDDILELLGERGRRGKI